jgi:hypothetical protein
MTYGLALKLPLLHFHLAWSAAPSRQRPAHRDRPLPAKIRVADGPLLAANHSFTRILSRQEVAPEDLPAWRGPVQRGAVSRPVLQFGKKGLGCGVAGIGPEGLLQA